MGGESVRSSVRSKDWRLGRWESSCMKYVSVIPLVSWPAPIWSRASEAMIASWSGAELVLGDDRSGCDRLL